ncbi:MAG: FAD-dependent oxidoreductase [Desulfobacterales bacterium]|nr:FAD-dependent oxidoreductase [Desulfobacterales bacterium]
MKFKKLFSPITIGNMELKNRIVMAPMATNFLSYGEINQRFISFYRERAKGGPGLIVISMTPNRLDNNPPFPGVYDDRFISGISKLAAACKEFDVKVVAQLVVTYSWAFPGRPVEFVSPSGTTITKRVDPPFRLGGPLPGCSPHRRPLKEDEIREIIEDIGDAAGRLREAGFDGVQYLAAAGYLVSQFISPITNQRTDSYGGNVENRMRFLTDILADCKQKAGEDWSYLTRISPQKTKSGITVDDLKEIALILQQAGVHAIDALPGWHEDPIPMIAPATPQGQWASIAQALKETVQIPIGAGTQIQEPEIAESILEEGKADYIYMCRAMIAEPDFPNLAKAGRTDEIRPCITCGHCLESIADNVCVHCSVNPAAGREADYPFTPAQKPKKVFVVGGGPAGLEAAKIAAARGHHVTLFEKTGQLGGQLNLAFIPPHKKRIGLLDAYLIREVERSSVNVMLNTEFTVETAERERPDVVIVAIGSDPIIPPIPGVDLKQVVTALDVLAGKVETGQNVVIIGGGAVGCETAEFLSMQGKLPVIIEMLDSAAKDVCKINRWHLISRLAQACVGIQLSAKVVGISDKGVEGIRQGKSELFPADTVVLAVGMRGNRSLTHLLRGKVPQVYYVGDCTEPRKMTQALTEGFMAGATA